MVNVVVGLLLQAEKAKQQIEQQAGIRSAAQYTQTPASSQTKVAPTTESGWIQ
jgi:hypothetical protein